MRNTSIGIAYIKIIIYIIRGDYGRVSGLGVYYQDWRHLGSEIMMV